MKIIFLMLIFILAVGTMFFVYNKNYEEEFNCNEFGILYLTPQEIKYASALSDKINGIVYIPETDSIIARTKMLDCENTELFDKFMFGEK